MPWHARKSKRFGMRQQFYLCGRTATGSPAAAALAGRPCFRAGTVACKHDASSLRGWSASSLPAGPPPFATPIAPRSFATLGGSAAAHHQALPDALLKDDLEASVHGQGEEVLASEPEGGEPVDDRPAGSQQHAAAAAAGDVLASLPLGAHLRVEAQAQGQPWAFEAGKLARLASGSCMVQCGNTTVLAAVTSQPPPWSRRDVLSLQFEVDYREKLYAVGRIPGTYNKREGSPKDHEVLAGRRIGRALRPLFPRGFAQDAAVFANVLSADGAADPGVMAVGAASAALLLSGMPWAGPVAAARVALTREGQLVVGPSVAQQEAAALDILVAVTAEGRVTMLEASGEEVPEARFVQALRTAVAAAQQLAEPQLRLAQQTGRTTAPMRLAGADPAAAPRVTELAAPLVDAILRDTSLSKTARASALQEAKEAVLARLRAVGAFRTEFARLPGSGCVSPADVDHAFSAALGRAMRRLALEDGLRVDGRGPVDLRPLHCEVDSIPVVHGSALFTRGETQSLCTVTVGRRGEQQRTESLLGGEAAKRLFVNYSFPPFAVGETSLGGMRRETGHSDLAERALLPVLPGESDFPFSLRLNADTLASSGSSSMAAVCGGSLALLDAGVPLKGMVAGVSVGLFTEGGWGGEARELGAVPVQGVSGVVPPSSLGRYELLLDQLGMEDQLGDMDLKVAGTRQGITACQLDVKLQGGLPLEVLEQALALAARGRGQLLKAMEAALPAERPAHAPAFGVVQVPPAMLGRVIGTGGANLKELEEGQDARLDVGDDGTIRIFAASGEGFRAAQDRVLELAGENIKEGRVYRATVTRLMDYGALVEVHPGSVRCLLHISELAPHRVRSVGEELAVGQEVEVMCLGRDARGQLKLSRKAVLQRNATRAAAAASAAQGGAIDPDK